MGIIILRDGDFLDDDARDEHHGTRQPTALSRSASYATNRGRAVTVAASAANTAHTAVAQLAATCDDARAAAADADADADAVADDAA